MSTPEAAWLPQLLEAVPVALVVFDASGQVIGVTAEARELLHIADDQSARSDPWLRSLLPTRLQQAIEQLAQKRSDCEEGVAGIGRIRASFTIRRAGDNLVLTLGEPSVQYDESIDFLSLASHELKTPLTAIKGGIQLLERRIHGSTEPLGDREKRLVSMVSKQVSKLAEMVESLLEASRLSSGGLSLVQLRRDLRDVVWEAVESFRFRRQGVQIDMQLPGEPVLAYCDADRIRQALHGILRNAADSTDELRPVIVSLEQVGAEALVSVTDQGRGIPPDDQPYVLDRFYKGGGMQEGLGLGLYITAELVRLHGGRIWFETEAGKGTSFHFSLPVSD